MPRYIPQMTRQLLDQAREAGRRGNPRLPDSFHAVDTSDWLLIKALDAHAEGLAEHAPELRK